VPRLILIVEDTAALAASLALAMEAMDDTEAVVYGNAKAALEYLLKERRPLAAVVTDLNLPDGDGFTLIKQVREIGMYSTVPVILITAQESPAPKDGHALSNPNAIFQKPFSMKEVRRVLETLL
jgi:DNA-binding response OmpR family regulator